MTEPKVMNVTLSQKFVWLSVLFFASVGIFNCIDTFLRWAF